MKSKIYLIIILAFVLSTFTACSKTKEIKYDDLIDLVSEKGTELNWSDFKKYESTSIGDGIYTYQYDVEGDYILSIGGKSLENKPWFFKLKNNQTNEEIDILSQDIISFLGEDY